MRTSPTATETIPLNNNGGCDEQHDPTATRLSAPLRSVTLVEIERALLMIRKLFRLTRELVTCAGLAVIVQSVSGQTEAVEGAGRTLTDVLAAVLRLQT